MGSISFACVALSLLDNVVAASSEQVRREDRASRKDAYG